MKILMMTNTYTPIVGGVERSIMSFSNEFRKAGHRVVIIAPEFEDQPENEDDVLRLPAIQNFNKTDFSVHLPQPRILSGFIQKFQPDLIHSHHPFLVGDLALRISSQYDIPIVFTYHTMFEDYVHYLPIQNERIRRFVVELAAGYANLVHRVIAPSQSIKQVLLDRDVHTPIDVIPTGIDNIKYADGQGASLRQRLRIPEDAFVIGHVGRLAKEKNLEFMCSCLIRYLREHDQSHVLFVGKGPMEKQIRNMFDQATLNNRCHMTGVLQDQDLIDSYHAMDVFAFASQSETQGVVLTESMASGTPVVALDGPGVRDVVEDRKNGRLVMKEQIGTYVDALEWLELRNHHEKENLKANALATAQNYSMERCSGRMMDLYQDAVSRKHVKERHENSWEAMMHRFRTEWDLLRNIKEAGEAAMK